jgi:hypothetical protein
MSCKDCISASEFDVIGAIHSPTILNERGQEVRTDAVLYADIRAKHMNPLRTDTSEVYEFNQEVALQKNSWLIRSVSSQTITANKMSFVENGNYHEIRGIRKYKGGRKYLVLDTILRDNQTDDFVAVDFPTNLVLTPAYNWINLAYSAPSADSVNIYVSIDGATKTLVSNTSDLTSYDYFQTVDQVNLLEFSIEAVVGAQKSSLAYYSPYKTWLLDPVLDINARELSQYTLDGEQVISYESLDPDGILLSQSAPSQRPDVKPDAVNPESIEFTAASSDFLSYNGGMAKFNSLYAGNVFFIQGVFKSPRLLVLQDTSVGNIRFRCGSSGGKSYINISNGGDFMQLSTIDNVDTGVVIEWKTDGTEWFCFFDDVPVGIAPDFGTTNDGRYLLGLQTLDAISIGGQIDTTPSYWNTEVKQITMSKNLLHRDRSTEYVNYIKKIHNL